MEMKLTDTINADIDLEAMKSICEYRNWNKEQFLRELLVVGITHANEKLKNDLLDIDLVIAQNHMIAVNIHSHDEVVKNLAWN